MKFDEKLTKQISETAYLCVENTNRYRPIMRFFYNKHEVGENYLFKEDVYNALKQYIPNYTMEECIRDLDYLVSKLSLVTIQDTENADTIEKFKYNNFRYEMSDYAVEIERMTIYLEEMEVKVSSLEPRLFERIYNNLSKFSKIEELSTDEIYDTWVDLENDFDNLTHSYRDFIKQFQNPKTEELLQLDYFLEFKNKFITYLNDFIKIYINYNTRIQNVLKNITDNKINIFLDAYITHQKSIPSIKENFDFDNLREVKYNRYLVLSKWFLNESGMSEGERLLNVSNNLISKITKYASSLIALHGNMIKRKEDYKYLCHMFDNIIELKEAHALSSAVLGVIDVIHYQGISNSTSDSLVPSLGVDAREIFVEPMHKREKRLRKEEVLIDKTWEKNKVLEDYKREEERIQNSIKNLIKKKNIKLENTINLNKDERRYIFKLLEKIDKLVLNTKISGKDPVFGFDYNITIYEDQCYINSEDGVFMLNKMEINFEGDLDD